MQTEETKKIRRNWTTINIRWERIEHEMCLVPNKINRFACQDVNRHSARQGPRGKKKLKTRKNTIEWKLSWKNFLERLPGKVFPRSLKYSDEVCFSISLGGAWVVGWSMLNFSGVCDKTNTNGEKILHGHDRTYLQQFSFLFASHLNACWLMITWSWFVMKWPSNWKSSTVNCIDEAYRKIAFKLNAQFPINELQSFSNPVTKPPSHPQLIPDHEKRFSQSNSFSKMQFCEIQFNKW